eukprot:scaffold6199_cov296-Prasinococcus_capsulatus_cf.AAC.2
MRGRGMQLRRTRTAGARGGARPPSVALPVRAALRGCRPWGPPVVRRAASSSRVRSPCSGGEGGIWWAPCAMNVAGPPCADKYIDRAAANAAPQCTRGRPRRRRR